MAFPFALPLEKSNALVQYSIAALPENEKKNIISYEKLEMNGFMLIAGWRQFWFKSFPKVSNSKILLKNYVSSFLDFVPIHTFYTESLI